MEHSRKRSAPAARNVDEGARMAEHFFDTSAVAKHYRAEIGTAKVDALLALAGSRPLISGLAVVELHSTFALLTRTGQITARDFNLACGRFVADITSGLWQVVPVSTADFQKAQQLVAQYGTTRDMR